MKLNMYRVDSPVKGLYRGQKAMIKKKVMNVLQFSILMEQLPLSESQ